MKKFILSFALAALLTSSPAFAGKISVAVNGMVCAFCVSGIEKVFKAREEVESIKVDLEKKLVSIITKKDKTIDDATVTKLITDAGYSVTGIKKE